MGTPNFVRFSTINGKVFDAANSIQNTLTSFWQATLRETVLLRRSIGSDDGGLALDGDFQKVRSLDEAQRRLLKESQFALIYSSHLTKAEFYIYFFDITEKQFSVSLAIERSMVYYRDHDFNSGAWLEGLLTRLVCALGASVCGYGLDDEYMVKHEPLDPNQILTRLRNGDLLILPRPIFHAISVDLVSTSEILKLIETFSPKPDPEYRQTGMYHLLGRIGM